MKLRAFIHLGTLLSVALFAPSALSNASDQNSLADEEPAVVSAVAPYYPQLALAKHAIGKVVVDVTIDNEGTVTAANAVSGHPLLQKVCEVTAKRWRFVEARNSSSLRRARLSFVFSFRSDKPDPSEGGQDLITFTPPYQVELSRSLVITTRDTQTRH